MLTTREKLFMRIFTAASIGLLTLIVLAPRLFADDYPCPANAKSCKVLTLTPEEQDMLLRDKGILQTALAARPLDLGAIVQYWVNKIETAPAGKVAEPPKEAPKPESVPLPPHKPKE